ncbi:MAG: hypothetical protein RLZZ323_1483 [Bacteroidota bacterium]|jgi:hypothetical protein
MSEINLSDSKRSSQITMKDLFGQFNDWICFLWPYKFRIVILSLVGGILGFLFAHYFPNKVYTAKLSFTMEQKNGAGGALGGLASSLGLGDVGGNSSGMFGGENILYLLKSNRIIHQSLREPQEILNGDNLLNFYLKNHFKESLRSKKIKLFPKELDSILFNRSQDSIIQLITKSIRENQLTAERQDNKTSIINLDIRDVSENWAFLFSKSIVRNAINLYLEIKVGKLLRTESELTHKKDSIRGLLNGSITTLAFETDLNTHTPLMRYKTNQVKKQIDVEVLRGMYANMIQNLEMTKFQRAQEEPIIEIIDEPIMPLNVNKRSRLLYSILGSIIFSSLLLVPLFFKRMLD